MLLEDFFVDYGKQDCVVGEFVIGIILLVQVFDFWVYKILKWFDQDIFVVLGVFNIICLGDIVVLVCIVFGGMVGILKCVVNIEQVLIG